MNKIAAISTPIGQGGIGIIRISGEKSLEIIKKIFKSKKNVEEIKSYTIKYGYIYDENELIDEVLVSFFKGPKSYTGEDICEINCHGGNLVIRRILDIVLKNGAKLAEPGEFTKRAFLNGKLDLSQAEAVMDVINSKSIKENKISIQQLEGYLGRKIRTIKEKIIDILVDIEANIDYPEYDLEEVQREKISRVLEESLLELETLENSFEEGKILKEGINTVIVGRPNVGKSSLLNALLKEDRAIVTSIAGTTRDTIEESLTVKGIPLKIIDTAGIRETNEIVEGIGVEKSKKALERADLVLLILDSTEGITTEDKDLLNLIKDKNYIVLINKIDVGTKIVKEDVLKAVQEISNNEIGIYRAKIKSLIERTSFEVYSFSKLLDMEWSYMPLERNFEINSKTDIYQGGQKIMYYDFLDYTENSQIDNIYTVFAVGDDAILLSDIPYTKCGVTGTIYNIGDDGTLNIKNAVSYNETTDSWEEISLIDRTIGVAIDTNAVIIKDNEIVDESVFFKV